MPVPTGRMQFWSMATLLIVAFAALSPFAVDPTLAAWPSSPPLPETAWPKTTADQFIFAIQPPHSGAVKLSSDAFKVEYGPAFSSAANLAIDVLGGGFDQPVTVYGYLNAGQFQDALPAGNTLINPHAEVVVQPEASVIRINVPAFLALSVTQSVDAIRYATAAVAIAAIGKQAVPMGLLTGLSLYVELPTSEQLAKLAAQVQTADKADTVISWFDVNRVGGTSDVSLARAESYSIVAYLISRFDIPSVRALLADLAAGATWHDAMRSAFQTDPTTLEQAWRANLPTWTTTGWRDNLMASFDLQPARDLLASGQYVSAKAVLDPSLNLYRQLNDAAALTDVQALVNEADTGIQAEALMIEVEAALTAHDYERASNLLDQAQIQYASLPQEQVPGALLSAYRERASNGLAALGQLKEAQRLAKSWGRYPEARKAAEEAGSTFATLGDPDNRANAQAVIQTLDNRQRRLLILVGTLGVTLVVWLALWLRSRGKPTSQWGYT
jgi:hypothetical protein